MLSLRIVLGVTLLAVFGVRHNEACNPPRFRPYLEPDGYGGVKGGIRVTVPFSKRRLADRQCEDLDKAIIKRQDWRAMAPRHQTYANGVSKNVLIWQTGSDVCHLVGLTGNRCHNCLRDSNCLPGVILALQDDDLKKGNDDIRYNFLIGQDGVIYEGRGWGVVGEQTGGEDDKSIAIAMIGDFNSKEPNEASQDALNKLLRCGKAAGELASDVKLSSSPKMAGQAFFSALQRCKGPCV